MYILVESVVSAYFPNAVTKILLTHSVFDVVLAGYGSMVGWYNVHTLCVSSKCILS